MEQNGLFCKNRFSVRLSVNMDHNAAAESTYAGNHESCISEKVRYEILRYKFRNFPGTH